LAYENSQRIAFDFKALKAMNEQNRRTAVEMAKQKSYMHSWDEDKTNDFGQHTKTSQINHKDVVVKDEEDTTIEVVATEEEDTMVVDTNHMQILQ
jgi:hypothetical protein